MRGGIIADEGAPPLSVRLLEGQGGFWRGRSAQLGRGGYGCAQPSQNPHPFDKLRAGSVAKTATRVGHPFVLKSQNPGGLSPTTPKARSSARPALTMGPSSNRRPIKVTPWGTRRGGANVGRGWSGSGAQSLRAFATSTKPARSTRAG